MLRYFLKGVYIILTSRKKKRKKRESKKWRKKDRKDGRKKKELKEERTTERKNERKNEMKEEENHEKEEGKERRGIIGLREKKFRRSHGKYPFSLKSNFWPKRLSLAPKWLKTNNYFKRLNNTAFWGISCIYCSLHIVHIHKSNYPLKSFFFLKIALFNSN